MKPYERPKADTMQINFRIPKGWPDQFQELAVKLTADRGTPITKSQAMREAMVAGWRVLMEKP